VLPVPFNVISQLVVDRGQLGPNYRFAIDLLFQLLNLRLLAGDLDLLHGHNQEQRNGAGNEQDGSQAEPKPWMSSALIHRLSVQHRLANRYVVVGAQFTRLGEIC
jgi:hypothetical protein